MRTRKYTINIDLYGVIINLYISASPQKTKSRINGEKESLPENVSKDGDAEAFFLWNEPDDKEYDVIFHPSAGPYLISHEALHVTLAICSVCGITVNSDNDEPITYLHSHIVEEIDKRIRKKTAKINYI